MEQRVNIPMNLVAAQKGGGKIGDEILVHSYAQAEYLASKGVAEFLNSEDQEAAKGQFEALYAEQSIDPHMGNELEAPKEDANPEVTSTEYELAEEEGEKRKRKPRNTQE